MANTEETGRKSFPISKTFRFQDISLFWKLIHFLKLKDYGKILFARFKVHGSADLQAYCKEVIQRGKRHLFPFLKNAFR